MCVDGNQVLAVTLAGSDERRPRFLGLCRKTGGCEQTRAEGFIVSLKLTSLAYGFVVAILVKFEQRGHNGCGLLQDSFLSLPQCDARGNCVRLQRRDGLPQYVETFTDFGISIGFSLEGLEIGGSTECLLSAGKRSSLSETAQEGSTHLSPDRRPQYRSFSELPGFLR